MIHQQTFVSAVVLSVFLALNGCGGGGGGRATIPGAAPEPPAPEQEPPPPCIQTHEDGCLSGTDFQAEPSWLAQDYRDDDVSFDNQWGLETVNADWAYANVELLKGQDAKPGAGVTIGFIDTYSEQQLRTNLGTAITAMAQSGRSEKAILIWAAGNVHGDPCDPADVDQCENGNVNAVSVEVMPGLVARIAELRGHSLAVVAVRSSDGKITSFSNRCGIAAAYCLAAPGQSITVAHYGPHQGQNGVQRTRVGNGTSYAAPMVAGGLAVMKQLFREQLSNTALVTRLLTTADDSGDYADTVIYGQGLMDLKAATSPVGMLEIVPGTQADGPGLVLGTTGMRLGVAFGEGSSDPSRDGKSWPLTG